MSVDEQIAKFVKLAIRCESELADGPVKHIKELVRCNPDHGPLAAWSVMLKHLKSPRLPQRCGALKLCDILFQRSHRFRSCVLRDLDEFGTLLFGSVDHPLPEKQTAGAARLRTEAVEVINSWMETFGIKSQPLSLALRHLLAKSGSAAARRDSLPDDSHERARWRSLQLHANVEKELDLLEKNASKLSESIQDMVSQPGESLIFNIFEHHESTADRPSHVQEATESEMISASGLATTNYEVVIPVRKQKIVVEKVVLEEILKSRNFSRDNLPRLCRWEQDIIQLQQMPGHVESLQNLAWRINNAKQLITQSLSKYDALEIVTCDESSEPEMEDVLLP